MSFLDLNTVTTSISPTTPLFLLMSHFDLDMNIHEIMFRDVHENYRLVGVIIIIIIMK